jgi:hypothetical protein
MIDLQDHDATSPERRSELYKERSNTFRQLAKAAQSDDVRLHFIRLTSRYEELAALEDDTVQRPWRGEDAARVF